MNPHPPIPVPACPSPPTPGVVSFGNHDLTQTIRPSNPHPLHLPPRMTTAERREFRAAKRAWNDAASAAIVAAVNAVKETYRPGAPISSPADGRPAQLQLSVR
jgi:hypothetical protein